jgi:hypothetical protein
VAVTWWVCTGVTVVPAVQVCAGQAAKRGSLCRARVGRRLQREPAAGLFCVAERRPSGTKKIPECYLNGGMQVGLRDLSTFVPRVKAFQTISLLEETFRLPLKEVRARFEWPMKATRPRRDAGGRLTPVPMAEARPVRQVLA